MFRNLSVCLWLIAGFIGFTTTSAPLPGQDTPSVEYVTPAEQPVPIAVPAAPESVEAPTAPLSSPPASGHTVTIQTGSSSSPVMVQMPTSAAGETPSPVYVKIGEEKGEVQETASSPVDAPRRSIAIMANVLDHLLSEQLGDDYRSRGVLSSGCRGYWIPDDGALFLLEVKFPLQDAKAGEEVKREEGDKDLWDQYEEKMSGDFSPIDPYAKTAKQKNVKVRILSGDSWFGGKVKFNPDKVEKLKKAVLTALAQYGHRLQGIPEEGIVTVIVDSSSSLDFGVEVMPRFEKMIERNIQEEDVFSPEKLGNAELSCKEWEDQLHNRQQYLELVKKQLDLANDRMKRTEQLAQTGRVSQAELDDIQHQALESQKALLEAEKSLHEAENQLIRARQELDNLKRRQKLEQEKAKIEEQQQKSLEDMESKIQSIQEQSRIFKEIMVNEGDDRAKESAKDPLKDLQLQLSDSRLVTISPGSNLEKPVSTMILRVPFKDLPKAKGEAKDLEGKVKITVY